MRNYNLRPEAKEKKKIRDKIYREKNKEKIRIVNKIYREKNKEKIAKRKKIYAKLNRKKINKYKNNWAKNKLKNDINFKIEKRLRNRIYCALFRHKKIKKYESFKKLIGIDKNGLFKYLESKFQKGMTRHNYGKWHIDHIKPCKAFDLTKPEEQNKCFHYTNLQPLWAYDNLSKGAKY